MPRGGSRPNTGGKRAGAGRKPVKLAALPESPNQQNPLEFLLATMRDKNVDTRVRLDAAKAAAPYLHGKIDLVGKKADKQSAAAKVAAGRFAPAAAPRLVVNNRG